MDASSSSGGICPRNTNGNSVVMTIEPGRNCLPMAMLSSFNNGGFMQLEKTKVQSTSPRYWYGSAKEPHVICIGASRNSEFDLSCVDVSSISWS